MDRYHGNNAVGGFSLFELIVAFALLSVSISAVIVIIFGSESAAQNVGPRLQAASMAQKTARTLFGHSQTDFQAVVSTTTLRGDYRENISVATADSFTKYASISESWHDQNGQSHSASLMIALYDWQQIREGNYCSFPLDAAAWMHPSPVSMLSVGSGNKATDIDVRKGYAYLSANSTSLHAGDFYIVDVTDAEHPFIQSQIDTGPGISAFAIYGDYAYIANQSLGNQLQIIDIRDPFAPQLIATSTARGVTGIGASGIGQSVFYYDKKIYLGLTKVTGPELQVFDVLDPTKPRWLGAFEVGSAVNAIAIKGTIAYIATPKAEELSILDVSDPSNIKQVSGYDAPLGSGNGKSLEMLGDTLLLGRTVGSREFYIVSATSSPPSIFGSADLTTSINDIRSRGRLSFMSTIDSVKEFQIVDRSDASHPSLQASLDLSARATALDCSLDDLFVTTEGPDSLVIVRPGI